MQFEHDRISLRPDDAGRNTTMQLDDGTRRFLFGADLAAHRDGGCAGTGCSSPLGVLLLPP